MRVCTQTVLLVPSWPETWPLCFAVCVFCGRKAVSVLFRPTTVASCTVSSSRLSAEEMPGLTSEPSGLCLGSRNQMRAKRQCRSGTTTLTQCPKISLPSTGLPCSILNFIVVTYPTYCSKPLSLTCVWPRQLCLQCPAKPRWPSFRALSRTTSQAWRVKKATGSCVRGGWLRWDKEAHSASKHRWPSFKSALNPLFQMTWRKKSSVVYSAITTLKVRCTSCPPYPLQESFKRVSSGGLWAFRGQKWPFFYQTNELCVQLLFDSDCVCGGECLFCFVAANTV